MASEVDIYNIALIVLGEEPVNDPLETRARPLRTQFAAARDATIRAHPWNFAGARALLGAKSTPPAFEYARAFALPADPFCLRVVNTHDHQIKWVVEGRELLTDAPAPLAIKFLRQVTDPQLFDALFVQALGARLAHATAYKITASRTKEAAALTVYKEWLKEARGIDGQEGWPEAIIEDEFLEARN